MSSDRSPIIRLHPKDNVGVVTRAVDAGERLNGAGVSAQEAVAAGHKLAIEPIRSGEVVFKLGVAIGVAKQDIGAGAHVHLHNLEMPEELITIEGGGREGNRVLTTRFRDASFDGYLRPTGRAGTRNYIGILPTVNCSATVSRMIADNFRVIDRESYPNVDGVVALTHGHGCTVAAFSEGYELIQRTLAGYARNPNFGAVLVLGLGCEDNPIRSLIAEKRLDDDVPVHFLEIQKEGGTRKTVAAGIAKIQSLMDEVNRIEREPLPLKYLTLALQCGGSDGFSAMSANPALGVASDLLIDAGGSSILAETPEIYGVAHLLKGRAIEPEVADRLEERLVWWVDHAQRWDGSLDENPTAGNQEGGLTTIIEKALGSASKGGHAPLVDVILYGEPVRRAGLTFMDSPGNDWVSVTGQVASGANLICFTTGRGSVFGCRPTPSVKLATNTPMYRRMEDDMDVNCGLIVDGEKSLEEMGEEILELIVDVASGRQTKSEELGFGQEEMVPWVISQTV